MHGAIALCVRYVLVPPGGTCSTTHSAGVGDVLYATGVYPYTARCTYLGLCTVLVLYTHKTSCIQKNHFLLFAYFFSNSQFTTIQTISA